MKDDKSDDRSKVIILNQFRKTSKTPKEIKGVTIDVETAEKFDEIIDFFGMGVGAYEKGIFLAADTLSIIINELKNSNSTCIYFNCDDDDKLRMNILCLCPECTSEKRGHENLRNIDHGHCRACLEIFDFSTAQWDSEGYPFCSQKCFKKGINQKHIKDDKKNT